MYDFVSVKEFPDYLVNRLGQIKRLDGKLLKTGRSEKGYVIVHIKGSDGNMHTVRVHRLVAMAFIPNPNNYPEVNHIDGNKLNNTVSNLEWCTKQQNIAHARQTGLAPLKYGFSNPYSILTKDQVDYIKKHYKARDKQFGCRALAKKFNVHHKTISDVINNKRYVINGSFCEKKS